MKDVPGVNELGRGTAAGTMGMHRVTTGGGEWAEMSFGVGGGGGGGGGGVSNFCAPMMTMTGGILPVSPPQWSPLRLSSESGLIPQLVALGCPVAHISQASIKNRNTLSIEKQNKKKKNPQIRGCGFFFFGSASDDLCACAWIDGAERTTTDTRPRMTRAMQISGKYSCRFASGTKKRKRFRRGQSSSNCSRETGGGREGYECQIPVTRLHDESGKWVNPSAANSQTGSRLPEPRPKKFEFDSVLCRQEFEAAL